MTGLDGAAPDSPWPNRWAWALCCATWPLVWIGGLITTTDAGMAVPDWPGTYGYNLFLYPWSTWLFGPWDLFVEHGHRLFASGVGMLTIALVVVVFRCDRRAWLRWLAVGALATVIGQGVLGGLRVVLNERLLAFAHGSTGPAFFALTAALVALTSKPSKPPESACRGDRAGLAWGFVPAVIYLQVIAGAALRHVPEDGSFVTFSHHVLAHLGGALAVSIAVVGTVVHEWRRPAAVGRRALATAMGLVLAVQLGLGIATWVAKYRLPDWAQRGVAADAWDSLAGAGTIDPSTAGGWGETTVVTAHSATGSLLLALATAYAIVARNPQRTSPLGSPSPAPARRPASRRGPSAPRVVSP